MDKSDRYVKGIGEVSIRVKDLDKMREFYEKVIGLEVISPEGTTLHHIVLNVALEDFESEKARLQNLGLELDATVHEWLHVRSMYFYEPEGNLLEFVAYDETVQ